MIQIKNHGFAAALLLAPLLVSSTPALDPVQAGDKWTQEELESVSAQIQSDVESIRQQSFKHPVAVELIDGAGFIRYVKNRMAEMSSPEQQSAEQDEFKLLGLIPAEMDLEQITMDMLAGQVGGFYDPAANTFYLMEAFTGDIARVILSHELTHALDDQLFDLDAGFTQRLGNRDSLSAYQAVAEGSGTAVMAIWTLQQPSGLNLKDLEEAQSMGLDALAAAPEVLWKPLLAAYTMGQAFLNQGYKTLKKAKKGASITDATNLAFGAPPRSTEQVLHPEKYWKEDERDEPQEVELALDAPLGWEVLDRSVFGELYLALITEEPKPIDFTNPMELATLKYTNDAAQGWGGDQAVLYGKGAARRLVLTTAWDTKKDSQEFETAMKQRLEPWRADVSKLDPEGQGSGVDLIVGTQQIPTVTLSIWFGCPQQ